jgi:murein DD-endopeptidase MepM/ murein hydrolase activator NlpD
VFLVPLGLTASLLTPDTDEQIQNAQENAQGAYRESASLNQNERVQKRILTESEKKLRLLEKQKRAIRLQLSEMLKTLKKMNGEASDLLVFQEHSFQVYSEEKDRLGKFVRESYVRSFTTDTSTATRTIMRRLLNQSLGEAVEGDLREDAIIRARSALMVSALQARDASFLTQDALEDATGSFAKDIENVRAEREKMLTEYRSLSKKYDAAMASLEATEEQRAEVLLETQLVEAEIARMMEDRARIEERLRTRAERELIQMGLRSDRPDRFRRDEDLNDDGSFVWPVQGRLTAGFGDGPYQKFFGVPHKAQDIAVPQGTQVKSAAPGIVYIARDGGEKGYSYILIVHRDGYATLYGHLSSFLVATGDQVKKGQVIGLSGATPGTHGAGPMTTGPHLHFEVIKNGKHIDPLSVLP